jgi:hypothetical protein
VPEQERVAQVKLLQAAEVEVEEGRPSLGAAEEAVVEEA